ncbi:MAG: hypothetical protein LBJ61_02415 [Deltaproteobacteria bacterium]|jgi:hypothetical protein|nr:hypothetical protein [Deltaproteobacteria bacterium]
MSFPAFEQKLLDNEGAGPEIKKERIPYKGYPGEIRFWPFNTEDLPDNWYFTNGDAYPLSGPVGVALDSLPAGYKTNWGITKTETTITLPNLIGYFPRAVDGTTRTVGSKQTDAMKNFSGTVGSGWVRPDSPTLAPTLPFSLVTEYSNTGFSAATASGHKVGKINFNPSTVVATADEFRPMNVGLMPVIYLEVAA